MNRNGIFTPLFYEPLKHAYQLIFQPEYRNFHWLVTRYGRSPRFHKRRIRIHGWDLIVPDVASFLSAYKEIFVEEIYAFPPGNQKPVILDCGANIGLSVLFFKLKYPHSRILAYEADPKIYEILKDNIDRNHITGIDVVNKAIWSSETMVEFEVEGADGGRVIQTSGPIGIKVPSISLLSLLQTQKFDFVKIDIEGAEYEALKDCNSVIGRVKYIFVEFHSFIGKKQELGEMINVFEKKGFRVHVHPPFTVKSPFLGIKGNQNEMDMQLNLFFWRE